MENKKYDAVLYLEPLITEDDRMYGSQEYHGSDGYTTGSTEYIDPEFYSDFSFGNALRSSLTNMGTGFSVAVTDFKKWVVVEVTHCNTITGRKASKTFLIVFNKKGDGMVLNTSNKFRTISGVQQASSYIRSASNALRNATNQKL